jgi:hypothetical protein
MLITGENNHNSHPLEETPTNDQKLEHEKKKKKKKEIEKERR